MDARVEASRITLARRLQRMTRSRLANELGVSVGAVTLWEQGERDATAKLDAIAEALKQHTGFFLGTEVPVSDASAISFRKRYDATRDIREYAAGAIDLASGVLTPAVYEVFGRLPETTLPNLGGLKPEHAAEVLREEWNLGDAPLRSTVEQLEARGVRVFWVNVGSPSLSAFCKWVDGEPFVILNSAKRDGCRSRYDACHELGHLALHRDTDFDEADLKAIENEANDFASAFLMPREPFLEDAPRVFDVDEFLELKSVWKVSVQSMVRRLYGLGAFTEWQYQQAFRMMSSWGWRSGPEPFAGPMETSKLHWLLCDRLDAKDVGVRVFVDDLGLKWETASQLMPTLPVRDQRFDLKALFQQSPLGIDDAAAPVLPYDD